MSNSRASVPFYSAFGRPGETIPGSSEEKQSFLKSYIPFVNSKNASASSTRANSTVNPTPIGASTPSPQQPKRHSGVMGYAKRGLDRATGSARSIASGAQQKTEEAAFFMNSDKLMYFSVLAGVGGFFIFLAFLFLPTIVFSPQKFALLFTMGSVCLIASLCVIRGFGPFVSHLMSKKKWPFSLAYLISLVLTLYASLFAGRYLLTFVSAIVQLISLFALLISYIPGGTRFLSYVKDQSLGAAKTAVPGMSGASTGTPARGPDMV